MSRKIVEEVLTPRTTKALWSATYREALPIVPQDFALGAVLPMVLYLMRRGHRRGKGRFQETFRTSDKGYPTVDRVAEILAVDQEHFQGFTGPVERAILGDLLLAFCLENKKRQLGRMHQVQRAYPAHYFSSWIDLPETTANLRLVPEMVTNLLSSSGHFDLGKAEDNRLLQVMSIGTNQKHTSKAQGEGLSSDEFDEHCSNIGLDQLLMVRLGQAMEHAPLKMKGENPEIPTQRPVADRAADQFCEDFSVFLRSYGLVIPRQSLVWMLESGISIGLTNIYLSTVSLMLGWATNGQIPLKSEQASWPLFVDCSAGTDNVLRRHSEESLDDLISRLQTFAQILMAARIIEQWKEENKIDCPSIKPFPRDALIRYREWLDDNEGDGRDLRRDTRRNCNKLREALSESHPQVAEILDQNEKHPVFCLAEALVILMGEVNQFQHFRRCLDSCLMMDQPHGLGRKRKSTVRGKMQERRALVLSNSAIEFLVHRHLRRAAHGTPARRLSVRDFVDILQVDYGFYVDDSPPETSIPQEDLRRNRAYLERKLRDLDLLSGVNDAESMKRLKPRFEGGR